MGREGFSPGGKTQGIWGTGVWLGLDIDAEGGRVFPRVSDGKESP